jgi:hypothetical protein
MVVSGCATAPAGSPAELEGGFRREGNPAFTQREQAAIAAARQRVEQHRCRPVDAYYRVQRRSDSLSVCVMVVHRYEQKQPMFTIGAVLVCGCQRGWNHH